MLLLYRFGRVHFLFALSAYLPALGRTLRLLLPYLGGRSRGRILNERRHGGFRRDLGLHLGLHLGHGRLAHLQSSEVIRGHQRSSVVISGRLAHLQVHSGKLDILQTRLHSVVARDRRAKVDRIRAVTAVDDLMREAWIVHSETQSD